MAKAVIEPAVSSGKPKNLFLGMRDVLRVERVVANALAKWLSNTSEAPSCTAAGLSDTPEQPTRTRQALTCTAEKLSDTPEQLTRIELERWWNALSSTRCPKSLSDTTEDPSCTREEPRRNRQQFSFKAEGHSRKTERLNHETER